MAWDKSRMVIYATKRLRPGGGLSHEEGGCNREQNQLDDFYANSLALCWSM